MPAFSRESRRDTFAAMKSIVAVAALFLAFGNSALPQKTTASHPSLVGVWKVLHFCNIDSAGVETNPYGEAPTGVFVYTPSGVLSLQATRTPAPPLFAAGDDAPTDAERHVMFDSYFGYYGTYTITSDSTVIHHVIGGTVPSYIGTEQHRHYRIRSGGLNAPDTLSIGGNPLSLRCRQLIRIG
jgi:hypothetical protein